MTKSFLTIFFIILGFQFKGDSQKKNELFTLYLVRHSEKDFSSGNYADPSLTECGKKRSEFLSTFLSEVNLDAIYSTDTERTKKTALPTANSKKLEIELYEENDLECFSKMLLDKEQNALIVGHSYTTGVLAGLLVDENIKDIDLNIYNQIYQVVVFKKQGRLHIFHSSFECTDE